MYEYTRQVYYYETDKMGVVHHTNYLRWLEEARTNYFKEHDLAYEVTESYGLVSPVTDVDLKFKHPAKFGDSFIVRLSMIKYTGVRFRITYTIVNQNEEVLVEGETGHAIINAETHKPAPMNRTLPQKHEQMKALVEPKK